MKARTWRLFGAHHTARWPDVAPSPASPPTSRLTSSLNAA